MSINRNLEMILNWECGLTPINDDLKFSYSNQNGVSNQPEAKYSLNDTNGYTQKDDEIFSISKMN